MISLAQQVQASLPMQASRWWLAVSGGLDSICLLHLIKQMQQNPAISLPDIKVVHVHHGLQAEADAWLQLVVEQCQTYGFSSHCVKVQIDPRLQQQQGLEAAARAARYQVFEELLESGDILLLAQHANDQAETLLLRLLRGAGVAGLGAMRERRSLGLGYLQRPLLSVSRHSLLAYAQEQKLQWLDDPSNDNEQFERNYLRRQVMPLLQQRWPSLLQRVKTTSHIMQHTQTLLEQVAQEDYQRLNQEVPFTAARLPVAGLLDLSPERRYNLLRWWLQQLGELAPDYVTMEQIDEQVLLASADAQPCLSLAQGELRRAYDELYWLSGQMETARGTQDFVEQEWVWTQALARQPRLAVAAGYLQPVVAGLCLREGDRLRVTLRQGGERCQPQGRAHSQSLKKLLQEYQVPAWQRDNLPLFWVNDQLAMVGNLWICQGFAAEQEGVGWGWSADAKK
ncbi:MAG: tRNA lysidine(34) synthetase TilS [Gammaproteobacteria bacterium]|jgi:tRNA(Ile)-lysidine synthase|nr:tRNA lysidine(34) synthetase TilS [Gammaproteobacteria bacterium]